LSRLCDYTSVGTWTLPRIVGSAKAREMYLLNRKVDAAEALRIGLCSGVYESAEALMEGVYELAEELASAPPLALRRIKQNLNAADELSFVEGLDQVRTLVLLPPSQQRKPLAGFDPCALSTSQQGSWVWLVHRPSLIAHRSSRACVRACVRARAVQEAENHARAAFHPDAREAGAAFMQKRKGNFSGVGELPPWFKSRL
jgi:hypothetical protein